MAQFNLWFKEYSNCETLKIFELSTLNYLNTYLLIKCFDQHASLYTAIEIHTVQNG